MPCRWLIRPLVVAACLAGAWGSAGRAAPPAGEAEKVTAADEETERVLHPGLVAVYRSRVTPEVSLARVELKPAFYLDGSSPHPRLPPGPFDVEWTGLIELREPGPLAFGAFLAGEAQIEIDGGVVWAGQGDDERTWIDGTASFDREPGAYPLRIAYRALDRAPARLQIWWQGPSFAREPVPAWRLKHDPQLVPAACRQDELLARGRAAAERLGCAGCHRTALAGAREPSPGPSLAGLAGRVRRDWLLDWLADPAQLRTAARMPALFPADRTGFVERAIVADYLLQPPAGEQPPAAAPPEAAGDHRLGRRHFVSFGCAACHLLPDVEPAQQPVLGQSALVGLGDRWPAPELVAFLAEPRRRYVDGRMPHLALAVQEARDIAAYLLLWSPPRAAAEPADPPSDAEIAAVAGRLGTTGKIATALALLREKGCAQCHAGLMEGVAASQPPDAAIVDIPIPSDRLDQRRGCLAGHSLPRFQLDPAEQRAIAAYLPVAASERYPSALDDGQRLLHRLGCVRCHQRDSDRPPPIEAIGSTLGGAWLQALPYLRAPRLTLAQQKFTRSHLLAAVRDGVSGVRHPRYSYRMPAYPFDAAAAVRALAAADGELPDEADEPPRPPADPTAASLWGPALVGFRGYACVSCHVWNGQLLAEPDPGAIGTDLTRAAGRIRRDWLLRYLENPARFHPGTPMPTIFPRGQPATLRAVLDGDADAQRSVLWDYLALGRDAPSPQPPPPQPVAAPAPGGAPLVAQIPLRVDGSAVESVTLLTGESDLVIYDLATGRVRAVLVGGEILRDVQGRLRPYTAAGRAIGAATEPADTSEPALRVRDATGAARPLPLEFHGYERLPDGVRLQSTARLDGALLHVDHTIRIAGRGDDRELIGQWQFGGIPAGRQLELIRPLPMPEENGLDARAREASIAGAGPAIATPDEHGAASLTLRLPLPPALAPPEFARTSLADPGRQPDVLSRPGYRAIAYPRPQTDAGEDLVMPSAVAVDPASGRVFVASMKQGQVFTLDDPHDDGRDAGFDDYARGLFQEAYSMWAEPGELFVLHRRNLSRLVDADGDGFADRCERVAALPHGVADSYDYAYGLVRDRTGRFVISYAPYASVELPGSGGAIRLAADGGPPEEIAYGFRNPLGWCSGPEGEVFCTDNQGEWVATNKLCHVTGGRYYGFPHAAQPQHAARPRGKTAIWVPYGWARSLNGVTYDNTGGKFGPFAGQVFLAELMFGGAIVRANLERVNGEFQGACFPFWGAGLLGPLTLAFDPRGRLYVGSITEPGWMAQPDRGALYRLDFTGPVPFEMQSIHVRPRGFRIVFTQPVAAESAAGAASFQVEHYRYEYTGAYGSPELDRTRVRVEGVVVAADGRTVELTLPSLVPDRVYLISARGVRSTAGEPPVFPTGAYTLNEIPSE